MHTRTLRGCPCVSYACVCVCVCVCVSVLLSYLHSAMCVYVMCVCVCVCVLCAARGDSVAVFDLRMLSPSALHSSTSGSLTHTSHSQRPLHEWTPALRHPLTHLYMDRHKVRRPLTCQCSIVSTQCAGLATCAYMGRVSGSHTSTWTDTRQDKRLA